MKHSAVIIVAGLALAATSPATSTQAQNARSFVSGHGLDTNACTLTAPCRTFAAAFAQTVAGGEIDVLDSAGYGPLTIDKAISIVNDGAIASVLVPSGAAGITINANPGDAVSLRGLTIEGAGVGQNGIAFNSGQSLTIDSCVIRHLASRGIYFRPNAASNLAVSSTLSADNGSDGIMVFPSGSGSVTAVFNRVETNNNAANGIIVDGVNSTGTLKASVSDSVAAHNGIAGFAAFSDPGQAPTTLMLFHSVAAHNGTGIVAFGTGGTLRVAQSTVTGNIAGWTTTLSGVVLSAGDNTIEDNTSNETIPPSYGLK